MQNTRKEERVQIFSEARMSGIVKKVWVVHGPNLNLLGGREPDMYGSMTLADIDQSLLACAQANGFSLDSFQSNHEGVLLDKVHTAPQHLVRYIIINPGALTHTSVALRDALSGVNIPFIEVHLSNVYRREPFRRRSYLSDLAAGVIIGFGPQSYQLALAAAMTALR